MLQSDLQAERFTGRKISKLWAKEMFAFFWQGNYCSFNDAKAGMGFHYDCGERTRNSSTRGIVQQQIWQICYGFIIDTRLYYPLEEEVILSWN